MQINIDSLIDVKTKIFEDNITEDEKNYIINQINIQIKEIMLGFTENGDLQIDE